MSRRVRFFLLAVATPLAVVLACLGLETKSSNPLGWFLILVGIGYGAGSVIYFWVERDHGNVLAEEAGDRSFWFVIPGFLAVFFAPPLEYLYLPQALPRGAIVQSAGLVLILAAVLLRVWTRLALREQYTGHVQVQVGHRLVQVGPYRYVRHPGYAAFVLMALGVALGYSSLVGLAAIPLLLLPGLAYRIRVEERLLRNQFRDAYHQYAGRTKRLLPGIW